MSCHGLSWAQAVLLSPLHLLRLCLLLLFLLLLLAPQKADGPVELGGEGVKQPEMAYEADAHYKVEMPLNALAHELGGKELKAKQLNTGQ